MEISIQEVTALEALQETGSMQRASRHLQLPYATFAYTIAKLEERTGLVLIDRKAYRSQISETGRQFLAIAKAWKTQTQALSDQVEQLKLGRESKIRIVIDGIYNQKYLLTAIQRAKARGVGTKIEVVQEHLEKVEDEFLSSRAQFMISLLPSKTLGLESRKVAATRASLVCASQHPIVTNYKKPLLKDLMKYDLVVISGQKEELGLSTHAIDPEATYTVSDFYSKYHLVKSGLAYGWLPDDLIAQDLKQKELIRIRSEIQSRRVFQPRVYFKNFESLGPTAREILAAIEVIGDKT